jgi:hypothetical protein
VPLAGHCVSEVQQRSLAPPLVEGETHFQIQKRFCNEQKFGYESRWGPKTRTTVLARASINLLLFFLGSCKGVVSQTIRRRMVGWLVNNEWERIWKEATLIYSRGTTPSFAWKGWERSRRYKCRALPLWQPARHFTPLPVCAAATSAKAMCKYCRVWGCNSNPYLQDFIS